MRKHVNIDQVKLMEIHYQKAPLKQILNLPELSSEEKVVLLNFFSNSESWKLSINSIANNLGKKKNTHSIKTILSKLKQLGYLKEDEYSYDIRLEKINLDFSKFKNQKKTTTQASVSHTTEDSTPSTTEDSIPPTESSCLSARENSTNNIITKLESNKEEILNQIISEKVDDSSCDSILELCDEYDNFHNKNTPCHNESTSLDYSSKSTLGYDYLMDYFDDHYKEIKSHNTQLKSSVSHKEYDSNLDHYQEFDLIFKTLDKRDISKVSYEDFLLMFNLNPNQLHIVYSKFKDKFIQYGINLPFKDQNPSSNVSGSDNTNYVPSKLVRDKVISILDGFFDDLSKINNTTKIRNSKFSLNQICDYYKIEIEDAMYVLPKFENEIREYNINIPTSR